MVDSETSTSLPRLSRRDVLSTLVATAAGSPFHHAATVGAQYDPALIAGKAWYLASRKALALCRRQQSLETELVRTIGFPSLILNTTALGKPTRVGSLQTFDNLASGEPSIRSLREFVEAELCAQQARWDEADRRLGYSVALREEELALAREQELADDLFAAEALTIPGIVAKIEALIALDEPSEDADERPWPQLRQIRAELLDMFKRQATQST
ncbi:hypothetical protein ACMDCR_09115 [Labrys okinawensis]|uniref:hypothetical protein n=1 Tax=Labrys okinawensis TaxID=346911 RepID=UPI0039BC6942